MPRIDQPLSDVTRNHCTCRCHDLRLVKGEGSVRDVRVDNEAPCRLSMWDTGPAELCAFWRAEVMVHAMIASGCACEPDHRDGSGVGIQRTHDANQRFYYDIYEGRLNPRVRFRAGDDEGDVA